MKHLASELPVCTPCLWARLARDDRSYIFLGYRTPLVPLLSKPEVLHSLGHGIFELLFRDLKNIHHLK